MSDRMHPLSPEAILSWMMGEMKKDCSIFGCRQFYHALKEEEREFLGRRPENAVGAAAGPHTQLAQNIIASYVSGARVFELKTVQVLDGEDLHVSKPCILTEEEGYNCEWSTELTVPEARDEYIKAWVFLHFLAKEYGLGSSDGFLFNMSVGYDLDGIKSAKIDEFLESLRDASKTEAFRETRELLRAHLNEFERFKEADLDAISPNICSSVTISTMHGCPPEETEKIALYLLEEKHLNLFLKCNPTLVGYDNAKHVLDDLGYTFIHFKKESFDNDLTLEQAKGLLERLRKRAEELDLFFGVKMTNTFPVLADHGDLPDEMMYMSGQALLPLSLKAASLVSDAFHGSIPISYCGGAEESNIAALLESGLYPVTVCTDLLKTGGYGKFVRMVRQAEKARPGRLDGEKLAELSVSLAKKAGQPGTKRAPKKEAPKTVAPCRRACGICAGLCPNRANVILKEGEEKIMVHIDRLCNECGCCACFCPEKKAPYLERLTIFRSEEDLLGSANCGFAYLPEEGQFLVRWNGECFPESDPKAKRLPEEVCQSMNLVKRDYPWLL
ncbi:MAG: hypothetical protein IKE16_06875 [Solobacterium sp.]|nr:hypothetical protein [Solobacterium sp.]